MSGKGFISLARGVETLADEEHSAASASRMLKGLKEAELIGLGVAEEETSAETMVELTNALQSLVPALQDLASGIKQDRGLMTSGEKLADEAADAEKVAQDAEKQGSRLDRFGRWAWEKTKEGGAATAKHHKTKLVVAGLATAAGVLASDYLLPEYDELKRDCACTCQGFNKLNLNDDKWEKLNKILYCRTDDGSSCHLTNGECISDGADGTGQSCSVKNSNKKTASLYGITDKNNNFQSVSPIFTDWDGKTDNEYCPLENDQFFEDHFLNYHIHRATELAVVGGASGASIANETGSGMLGAAGGSAVAAVTGKYIPSEFPGHCLYRLFDSSEYTDTVSDDSSNAIYQDLKVIRCKAGDGEEFPEMVAEVRNKCSLKSDNEGEIITAASTDRASYNNRNLGTCVAWNKSPGGGGGKCKTVIHAPENLYYGLYDEISDSNDINCADLDADACPKSEYCYWHNEANFDDIYLCLNDVTLIKMHNDIIDGGGDNLIKSSGTQLLPKQKFQGDHLPVIKLETYNNKETDINDICNNYCINGLCNNPVITTMPAVPGVEGATNGLIFIIKYTVLFGLTLLIWFLIREEIYNMFKKRNTDVAIDGSEGNNKLLSGISFVFLIIMLLVVYKYGDEISEVFNLNEMISETILPIIDNIV
jgi:hypothetical protein